MNQKFNTLPEEAKILFSALKNMLYSKEYLSGNLVTYLKLNEDEANLIQKYWQEFSEFIKKETFWQVEKLDYNINGNTREYRVVVETHTFDRFKKRLRVFWSKIKR